MNSDHSPILLTVSEYIIQREHHPILTNKYTDWKWFEIRLNERINLKASLQNREQVDEEIKQLVNDIQKSVEKYSGN